MSLTPTQSMSAPRSLAARNRLRPMRPNPLIPAFTGMSWGPFGRREAGSPGYRSRSGDDLDLEAVRVAEVGRVVRRPVLGPIAWRAGDRTAVRKSRLVCAVDRGAAAGLQRNVPVTGLRPGPGSDPEHGLVDAPAERLAGFVQAPPAEREEDRVVEARAAREALHLVADVVDHEGRGGLSTSRCT